MTKSLPVFFIVFLIIVFTCSQYAHSQQRTLSSEELFLKQNGPKTFPVNVGEKYLVLNKAPRIGRFRRYRFFIGDDINVKVNEVKKRFKGTITSVSDSSFTIVNETSSGFDKREILLHDLRLFKVSRRIPFVSEAAYYFPIGGLLYIGADFFNKGIDDKRYTTDASAFIVGGALMAAGFVCYKLSSNTIKINNRNKLKVLTGY
jgi:hypothetical protein